MRNDVHEITKHYAAALAERGVSPVGVLWPNAHDLATRFEVLLGAIDFSQYRPSRRAKLLDVGCGPGFLLDYLAKNKLLTRIDYTGVDVTEVTMGHARARWPDHRFELRDVRDQPFGGEIFDYCIACGVFTARCGNTFDQMRDLVQDTLKALWPSVRLGVGFNVMSKHVDWERDDLFHWPLDDMMAFCKANLSRHVCFRLDYGLWEASALVLKSPIQPRTQAPESWLTPKADSKSSG
jgi:SAM-dependent methyltransferase